ncbi:hypothetical protein ACTSKR_16210 [Chitinibacteraceae bacterium HSL-7]
MLLLGNLPADVTLEEVRAFLDERDVPGVTDIELEPGTDRCAVLLKVNLDETAERAIASVLNGVHWRGHDLSARVSHSPWGQ